MHVLQLLCVGSPRVDQTLLVLDHSCHLSNQVVMRLPSILLDYIFKILAAGLDGIYQIPQLLVLRFNYFLKLNHDILLPIFQVQQVALENSIADQ